jgi:phage baseplate assembly protein W
MAAQIKNTQQSLQIRLGSDLQFPISNNFNTVSGMDLLLQDIQLTLLTLPGERVFRPSFGCTLRNQLWENIDRAATAGASSIRQALNTYEGRINLLSVTIAELNRNTDLIVYSIQFIVNDTDTKVNLVFPMRTSGEISAG